MKLGAFSISLNVKDIRKSKNFYKNLGFKVFGGDITQNWLVMKNKSSIIGLFQGMFDKNVITFSPGLDQDTSQLDSFTDIRDIEKSLKYHGIKLDSEIEPDTKGPASIMLSDSDGNSILFDQHV